MYFVHIKPCVSLCEGGYLSFRLSCIFVFSCCHVICVHGQDVDKAFHSVSSLLRSSLTRCVFQCLGYCADVAISWSFMKLSISFGLKLYFRVSHFFVSSSLGIKYGILFVLFVFVWFDVVLFFVCFVLIVLLC